ncbi:prenyltransferase and squalene oxidase repeat-containing domain protein [Ostertagia ostertagi]
MVSQFQEHLSMSLFRWVVLLPWIETLSWTIMSVSLWWCKFVRLVQGIEYEELHRLCNRYSKRKVLGALCAVIFVLYYLGISSGGDHLSKAGQCVKERFRNWEQGVIDQSIGVDSSSVSFIGNGHIGVDVNGELRVPSSASSILDFATGFKPFVNLKVVGTDSSAETTFTDFKAGRLRKIKCYVVDGECACIVRTSYVHRTKKELLVEEVKIVNPTKASITVKMERPEEKKWAANKTGDAIVYSQTFPLSLSSLTAAVMCSSVPTEYTVSQKREETIRFMCIVEHRELSSNMAIDTKPVLQELTRKVITEYGRLTVVASLTVDLEHERAWEKLNAASFYLSPSKAPNVLNGDRINATRYILMSNVKAPLLEESFPEDKRKALELSSRRNERCYSEHSTLLYPSKLWQDWNKIEDLMRLAEIWLLTLDKRGCASILKSGATGLAQAFTLSLSAASYHDSHLEVALSVSDLHRELAFGGLPIGIGVGDASARVRIDNDNTPYFEVSATSTLYACGGGCLGEPITLSKTPVRIPIKITKPETSILYIATSRRHLEQLRSTIHVSEVMSAPAHESELLALHRHGSAMGGLPAWFWFILVILLIAFHAFLAKLLWSEWRKGDMTPYNPYLRNRYASSKKLVSCSFGKVSVMSFAGFLDIARKDVDLPSSAPKELLRNVHADFITNFEKKKDSYPDALDRAAVVEYVKQCQRSDGGFAAAAHHDSHLTSHFKRCANEVDTRFSFCAVATLFLIDRLHVIDLDKAVRYVLSCYNFDGGFGTRPGSESHAGQVYCCLGTLCIARRLESIDRDRTAEWLAQRQCASGGLNVLQDVLKNYRMCAIRGGFLPRLAMLGRLDWVDKAAMIKFIYACQDDETGGFADRPGDCPDPFHTLFGIAGLSLLGDDSLRPVDAVLCMPKYMLKDKTLC